MHKFQNHACIITGGYGVIGKAIAMELAQEGMTTVIMGRDITKSEAAAKEISTKTNSVSVGVQGDVTNKESLLKAQEKIKKEVGKVDFLINGAGGNSPKATTKIEEIIPSEYIKEASFFGLDQQGFDDVFDLNFKGTLLPSMIYGEEMVKEGNGAIVNISSMNSYNPLTKIPAYSAAKAAINNFTQWLAVHFAKTGVRVNAIAPGFFLTNQNRFLLVDENTGEPTPRGQKIINNTPMGRYGDVDELAGLTSFLLSEKSSFITGVVIPVDGGYSAFGGV